MNPLGTNGSRPPSPHPPEPNTPSSLCAHPPPPSSLAGLPSPLRVPQRFWVPLTWPIQPHEQRRLGQQLPQRGVWHQHLQVGAALVLPGRRVGMGRGQGEGTSQALSADVSPVGVPQDTRRPQSSGEDTEQSRAPEGLS